MSDPYDGFTINLFLGEDGDWLAHFVELPHISAFADTPEGALHEVAVAWGAVKVTYRDEGMPIPTAPRQARAAG